MPHEPGMPARPDELSTSVTSEEPNMTPDDLSVSMTSDDPSISAIPDEPSVPTTSVDSSTG